MSSFWYGGHFTWVTHDNLPALIPGRYTEASDAEGDLTLAWLLTRLPETATLLEDRAVVSVVSFRLADSVALATADLAFTCVARQPGGAAALLRNSDEAAAYLQQALDIACKL